MWIVLVFGKDWRDVANVSRQDLRSVPRNVVRRCEACFEAGGRQFESLLLSKVSRRRKTDSIFPAYAGFVFIKAPVVRALFRNMITGTHCVFVYIS
jgi:hypothetical protein